MITWISFLTSAEEIFKPREIVLIFPSAMSWRWFLFRSLFTTGIVSSDGNGDVSRNTVKTKLKELVAAEDKKKPWSDEQLAGLLQDAGMPISRRTVAKYRMELGIGGVFQRKDG